MCAAAYPSPERSIRLGRQNLHMFRLRNTRFDIVGGILYFIFVVRCRGSLCHPLNLRDNLPSDMS